MKKFLLILSMFIITFAVIAADSSPANATILEENGGELYDEITTNKYIFNKRPMRIDTVLLIPNSTDDVVGMYDPYDGTYLGDLIVDDTSNPNYDLSTPINAIQGPDNNIYLSDQVSDAVYVFDSLGNYLLTYADASDGLNNIRGIDFYNGHLFVTSGDDYVAEFDGPHSLVGNFIQDGSDPFDILFLSDGRSLLCDIQGTTDNIRLYDSTGVLLYEIFKVSFPEQVQVDPVLPGAFLNNSYSTNRITDFDLDSTIVDTFTFSSGRGIYRLGNGNLLATNYSGVFELDSATGSTVEQENTGSARFIEIYIPVASSVEEGKVDKFEDIKLSVYPNPFIESMEIRLSGVQESVKKIDIHDLSGRLIKQLDVYSSYSSPAVIRWNGRDSSGKEVSPGIYFIRLNNNIQQKVVKVR